jgi:protein-S-isoprenylcysteine O-methyltransferase Ste14
MQLFQTGFFPILFSMALYGLLHSMMASHGGKEIMKWVFGESLYKHWYRLIFNFIAVLTLLPVVWLLATAPDQPLWSLPSPWNTIFHLVQLCGVLAVIFAVMQTGAFNFAGVSQLFSEEGSVESARLVTGGLYRLVRHPIYTFSLVVLWFSPTFTVNSLAFAIGVTGYFLVGLVFEERKLALDFGEDYLVYQRKTPALIPGLKTLVPSPVPINPREDR